MFSPAFSPTDLTAKKKKLMKKRMVMMTRVMILSLLLGWRRRRMWAEDTTAVDAGACGGCRTAAAGRGDSSD